MKNTFKKIILAATTLAISTSFAMATDLSSKSWDEIITQAKAEGEVTWYVWYFQDRFRAEVKDFEDKYGIKVTIPEGTVDANVNKLLAEKGREVGDIDVHAWGYDSYQKIKMGDVYSKLDMLPKDDDRIYNVTGIDGQGYAVAWWGNQTGLAYDPAKISEADLPQTPKEISEFWAKNPEKFGFNFEKGGSGPSFYQNTLRVLSGIDATNGEVTDGKMATIKASFEFFNNQAHDYVITASNIDSITRLSDGELTIVAAWEDHLAGLQNGGEVRKDIKFYLPEFGMSGGGNGVAIAKNAPHPAASAVFINWLTSAETQTKFNEVFGSAPMHAKADDSKALIAASQRKFSSAWMAQPLRGEVEKTFIEDVVLER